MCVRGVVCGTQRDGGARGERTSSDGIAFSRPPFHFSCRAHFSHDVKGKHQPPSNNGNTLECVALLSRAACCDSATTFAPLSTAHSPNVASLRELAASTKVGRRVSLFSF